MSAPIAIAVAVVLDQERVLVGQRQQGTPLEGMFEFPGGKILPGETPIAAVRRECVEETGLEVNVIQLMEITQQSYDHATVALHFFLCGLRSSGAQPLPPFTWMPINALAARDFPAGNLQVIVRLQNHRASGPSLVPASEGVPL